MAIEDELRKILAEGKALIICGAGVSAGLTGGKAPGWKALIEASVAYGKARKMLDDDDLDDCQRWLAKDTKTAQWLHAAERVRQKLGPKFRNCLGDQLEKLAISNPELLETIQRLHVARNAIATTNYDDLLVKGLAKRAVTWREPGDAMKIVRGDTDNVLHLHGHWTDEESVVFSERDYEAVTSVEQPQFVQKLAIHNRTVVFLGCSLDGLQDANIGKLLEWFEKDWSELGDKHYVLCRDKDKDGWPKAVTPVVYGTHHGDLASFLKTLAPPRVEEEARLEPDPHMIGRAKEKQQIVDWVQADNRPIIIPGGPGFGKSAMALAVAHDTEIKKKFGDERYFLRLDAAGDAYSMMTSAAAKLGIAPPKATADRIADAVAKAVSTPTLLILDNLESPWSKDREAVERAITRLAVGPLLHVISTIRGELPSLKCPHHRCNDLQVLSAEESLALFHQCSGDRFVGDPALPALLDRAEHHPLCITLLAEQADGGTIADLLKRWDRLGPKLLKAGPADHQLNNLTVSVGLSFDRLSPMAKRLCRLVARLPAGLALWFARNILGGEADEAAHELRKSRLVTLNGERLNMLAPLREVAVGFEAQMKKDRKDDATLQRLMIGIAAKGDSGLEKLSKDESGEIENLDAALLWAMANDRTDGLIEAQVGLATLNRFSGRGSTASVTSGITFWEGQRNSLNQAHCIQSLGDIAFARFDHAGARTQYEKALPLYRCEGDVLGEADCIRSLGDIAFARSDHDGARAQFEKALPLYQRVGDVLGEANCIKSLGDIALERSDHDGARAQYEKALPLYQRVGAVLGEAHCILSLGDIAFARSDHDGARAQFEKALPLYQRVGDVRGEANCIRSLGQIAFERSDYDGARAQYEKALELYGRIPEPYSMGHAHRLLARVTDGAERERHITEARRLWRSVGREDLVAQWFPE